MRSPPNHAARYRALADDAFAAASRMTDPETKRIMEQVAAGYEHLAWLAKRRAEPDNKVIDPRSDGSPAPA